MLLGLYRDDIFCLPEFCVDKDDLDSLAPDVVLYQDKGDRYPVVIVDITIHKEFEVICQKAQQLMVDYPQVKESFVYDYEKEEWQCFGKNVDIDEPSFSSIFEINLNDYLEQ